MNGSVYNVANKYREVTTPKALYIADPDIPEFHGFQIVSQRSCYVTRSDIPTNKPAFSEWFNHHWQRKYFKLLRSRYRKGMKYYREYLYYLAIS